VPTMCLSTYWIYASALRGRAAKDLADVAVAPAS